MVEIKHNTCIGNKLTVRKIHGCHFLKYSSQRVEYLEI